jgi:hypothetical protein
MGDFVTHTLGQEYRRSTSVEYFKGDVEHCVSIIDDEQKVSSHCLIQEIRSTLLPANSRQIPAMFTCTGSVHPA